MKKRTKIAGVVCAVALASAVAVPTAFAAGGYGRSFADVNGDGVCDNAASGQCYGYGGNGAGAGGANYVDANNDGVCDNYANGGRGANFVDANGDGVCDNAGAGQGCGAGNGQGCGYRGGR